MDDTPLHLAVGIDRSDGLYETLQAVHTEQIDVQNSPACEIIQHIQPEFATLMLYRPCQPHPSLTAYCNSTSKSILCSL